MNYFNSLKDNFQVSSLLCNQDSVLSSFDFALTIENAFEQISRRNNKRAEYYVIVANYIKYHQCPLLASIVERIPTLVEASVSDAVEAKALVFLLQETLKYGTSDVIAQMTKTLSKLVSTACKIITKHSNSNFGFLVLETLGKSRLRSFLAPNAKSVCQTCLKLIDHPNVDMDSLASVFGLFVSIESPEVWNANWTTITDECSRILFSIDIHANNNIQQVFASHPLIPSLAGNKKLRGTNKTLLVAAVYDGLCSILKQMLVHGCSTGPVSLNLTTFLPTYTILLAFTREFSLDQNLAYVESDQRVSPIDVSLVLTTLKISALSVVKQLFDMKHPSMALVATAFYRPIASLFNKRETRRVPNLQLAIIECLCGAARCFPNVVADSLNNRGSLLLIDILQREMESLVEVRSSVTSSSAGGGVEDSTMSNAAESKKSSKKSLSNVAQHASDSYQPLSTEACVTLFSACEAVLMHCSAMLSGAIRQTIEEVVGQGLVCLSKGILPPQYTDRKMHRMQCEQLRQDPVVQSALLRLAMMDVLVPTKTGLGSSNLSLLKRVCDSCSRQSETAVDATKILLVIGAILHPVAVCLPAMSSGDLAKTHFLNVQAAQTKALHINSQQQHAASATASAGLTTDRPPVGTAESSKRKLSAVEETVDDASEAKKVKVEASAVIPLEQQAREQREQKVLEEVLAKQTLPPVFNPADDLKEHALNKGTFSGNSNSTNINRNYGGGDDDDDDDDDELPEIDCSLIN